MQASNPFKKPVSGNEMKTAVINPSLPSYRKWTCPHCGQGDIDNTTKKYHVCEFVKQTYKDKKTNKKAPNKVKYVSGIVKKRKTATMEGV